MFDGDERADFDLGQALGALANSGRLPSSASSRRSSGWKIIKTAKAENVEAAVSSQLNTFNFNTAVTANSTTSATTKPMTTGQPRVPRKKRVA